MKIKIILGSIIIAALLAGCAQLFPPATDETIEDNTKSEVEASVTISEDNATQNVTGSVTITEEGEEVVEDADADTDAEPVEAETNSLIAYSASGVDALKAEGSPFALFFHAEWCPVCRAMEENVENEPEKLPQGVALLKVDYDNETALKQELGITQQSVWVIFDSQGNEVARNPGVDYDSLVADLDKAL